MGRRRYFEDGENPNELVNFPIQGAGASLMNIAIIDLATANLDIRINVPAIDASYWSSLEIALVGGAPQGTAAIVTQIYEDNSYGTPAVGATIATSPPGTAYLPFYDDGAALSWNQDATSAYGTALLFGVAVGDNYATYEISNYNATQTRTISSVPVEADATTFVSTYF